MKKLIVISLIIFLAIPAEAQSYSTMNQEQLQFALEKAKSKTSTGAVLTVLGTLATVGGTILYVNGLNGIVYDDYGNIQDNTNEALGGIFVMCAGMGMLGAGIPIWITGANKKEKIELQLLKYQGSASALGVGFKITF